MVGHPYNVVFRASHVPVRYRFFRNPVPVPGSGWFPFLTTCTCSRTVPVPVIPVRYKAGTGICNIIVCAVTDDAYDVWSTDEFCSSLSVLIVRRVYDQFLLFNFKVLIVVFRKSSEFQTSKVWFILVIRIGVFNSFGYHLPRFLYFFLLSSLKTPRGDVKLITTWFFMIKEFEKLKMI
ncbi:hypothetical protein C5167_023275 [Papaver somniferum]|uniref:Uncharacterized protein n=1 Tax=Papaver somniferum TaxID=3469 RepID=A0A4Y7JLR1_PAPSO|nr:hypothetical protein C5167_023275 [Papaver somniferum]